MTASTGQAFPIKSMESLLKVAENMDTNQLELLADSIVMISTKRRAEAAKETVEELTVKAKWDFTETEKRRFKKLIRKRQIGEISDAEMNELWSFIEMSEELTVRRVENVMKLASLKGISFQEMFDSLGFKKKHNVL
ncbi:MAG: hypothetical protein MUC59_18970 [Saprospiraceae bacterium]|jgi:hypothetical protein|nr:hypothetical protein [Saprospiraceae bacterium]